MNTKSLFALTTIAAALIGFGQEASAQAALAGQKKQATTVDNTNNGEANVYGGASTVVGGKQKQVMGVEGQVLVAPNGVANGAVRNNNRTAINPSFSNQPVAQSQGAYSPTDNSTSITDARSVTRYSQTAVTLAAMLQIPGLPQATQNKEYTCQRTGAFTINVGEPTYHNEFWGNSVAKIEAVPDPITGELRYVFYSNQIVDGETYQELNVGGKVALFGEMWVAETFLIPSQIVRSSALVLGFGDKSATAENKGSSGAFTPIVRYRKTGIDCQANGKLIASAVAAALDADKEEAARRKMNEDLQVRAEYNLSQAERLREERLSRAAQRGKKK